jgi:hypothetical protein
MINTAYSHPNLQRSPKTFCYHSQKDGTGIAEQSLLYTAYRQYRQFHPFSNQDLRIDRTPMKISGKKRNMHGLIDRIELVEEREHFMRMGLDGEVRIYWGDDFFFSYYYIFKLS